MASPEITRLQSTAAFVDQYVFRFALPCHSERPLPYAARFEARRGHRSSSNVLNFEACHVAIYNELNCFLRASGIKVFHGTVEFFNNNIDKRMSSFTAHLNRRTT
jgi:hypothetical protein